MRYLIILVSGLLLSYSTWAQTDIPFDKDNFKDRKDEFKTARKDFDEGMKFMGGIEKMTDPSVSLLKNFKMNIVMYRNAIPFFERAAAFNPNYSVLNYNLGKCYMASNQKFKAADLLEKAYKANPTVSKDIHFFLGWAYHVKNNWEKAKYHYEQYKKTLNSSADAQNVDMVNKKLFECTNGEKLEKNPIRVWVDNLGININTQFPEYSPLITADESTVIFTARRSDTYKGGIDENDGQYYEDIYIARKNEKGQWEKAQNLGSDINTDNHDAPAGLSADGKTLFVFYGWKGAGDIYVSKFENNKYSKPEKLPNDISGKDTYESSAAISYDGKELYFASTRPGGFGEEDIYMSKWDEKKKTWGVPVNLGSTINTKYRETGIFLHPDGETMYFASEGHESMGGFDIFMSKRVNGVWGKPVNVGYPVNSSDDDVFFVTSGSGRYAYYTSFREDGFGEKDLYRITFLGPEKQPLISGEDNLLVNAKPVKEVKLEPKVEITTASLIILKGTIRDEQTKLPLGASIELIDNEKNELITSFTSDGTTGKYMITIPGGINYGIAVKADGYLFHSENIFIPKSSGYREYQKDIDLKKIEVGKAIVLRNIFYDFDKATLRSESTAELERLIKLMNENPTLKIELSSHTDSRGSDTYNQKLSEDRAKSVVDYLVTKGINSSRLVHKGYGETQLLVSDDEIAKMKTNTEREEAHQMNRRTEFKILSK